MKKSTDIPILKKVSTNHNHTHMESEISEIERTTSYESSHLGRLYDITSFRRTSTSSKGDNNQSPVTQRRNSFITFESNDSTQSISQIKTIYDPAKYMKMDDLQIRVWKTLIKCANPLLQSVFLVDIIVLYKETEYEFKFDLSPLSCFMTINELCDQIHLIFQEQKNERLNNPHLHHLIGVIKTQKLDGNMRLFELVNILLNGNKTLILQQSTFNF